MEVEARLPDNERMFRGLQGLQGLHPFSVLSQVSRLSLSEQPMRHWLKKWQGGVQKIIFINWQEEEVFQNGIPLDMAGFWIGVMEYKDSLGHHHFRDLATYAITCLAIPISNAMVEGMFSQDTLAMSSLRSRMSLTLTPSN